MHMADALLSPAVGGTMWAVSAGMIAFCSHKVRAEMDDSKVPLMGVLGAFIFAAQMINFSIPVTGSSGHLGGGLILSVLLGPYAAFLSIASVLVVQALFFADGGLLALGCNIFNLGFFPAFIAYPVIFRKIIASRPTAARILLASMIAAIAGLQLGAFSVVVETVASGISSLPFSTFAAVMQPIHLAIGIVEGLVTASLVSFLYKARPEMVSGSLKARQTGNYSVRNIILAFLLVAAVIGGLVSWFASKDPDGLEWSINKVTGREELKAPEQGLHSVLASLQEKSSFLQDYSFRTSAGVTKHESEHVEKNQAGSGTHLGTSVSGLVGGLTALGLSFLIGRVLKRRKGLPPESGVTRTTWRRINN